jgi:hypothetical protein
MSLPVSPSSLSFGFAPSIFVCSLLYSFRFFFRNCHDLWADSAFHFKDRLLWVQLNCCFVLPHGILRVMYSYIPDRCTSCVCSYMFRFCVNVLPLTSVWCQPHPRIHSPVNVVTLVSLCHQQNDHQVDWRQFYTHTAVNLQRSWNEQWLSFRAVLCVHRPVHE